MEINKYIKNKNVLNMTLLIVLSFALIAFTANAATTISTNIVTGGTLSVTGASTLTGDVTAGADLIVTSGARIGTGSSGGHITAVADDSLFVEGQAEFDGIVWFDGQLQASSTSLFGGTLTVGVDDTGYDVTLYGATSGQRWLWDESADTMDINGTSQLDGTLTVGVNDTGYDVKFFGATASKFAVWDESADDLILADAVALQLGGDESTADGFKFEFDGTSTLNINALTANDGLVIGGTTSTDFTLTGATKNLVFDASADTLTINPAVTFTNNLTVNQSATTTVTFSSAGINLDSNTFVLDPYSNLVGIGTSTPLDTLHIENQTATTTQIISTGAASKGGRIIIEDVDGAGCTEITALNGALTAKVVTCPTGI